MNHEPGHRPYFDRRQLAGPGAVGSNERTNEREAPGEPPDSDAPDSDPLVDVLQQVGRPAAFDVKSGDPRPPKSGKPSGRPPILVADRREKVLMLISVGLSRRQAAAYLGIHPSTISHAAQRDKHFAEELERAETLFEAEAALHVVRASRRSWRAAAWLLKNNRSLQSRKESSREDMEVLDAAIEKGRESAAPREITSVSYECERGIRVGRRPPDKS